MFFLAFCPVHLDLWINVHVKQCEFDDNKKFHFLKIFFFSTWWNGKGGVQSTAPGSQRRTSSTQDSSRFLSLDHFQMTISSVQVFEDSEAELPSAKRGPKPKSLKEKEAKRKEKEVRDLIFWGQSEAFGLILNSRLKKTKVDPKMRARTQRRLPLMMTKTMRKAQGRKRSGGRANEGRESGRRRKARSLRFFFKPQADGLQKQHPGEQDSQLCSWKSFATSESWLLTFSEYIEYFSLSTFLFQICCRGCRTTKQKVQRFRWRYNNNINNNGHCNKPENNNRKPEDHPTIIVEQPKQYNRSIQKYNQQRQNLRWRARTRFTKGNCKKVQKYRGSWRTEGVEEKGWEQGASSVEFFFWSFHQRPWGGPSEDTR